MPQYPVAAVGMGDPVGAQAICQRHAPQIHCILDDDQQTTYQRYGVGKATLAALFAPTAFRESISTIREFGMGDANGGDVKQMPATFVIGPDGRFRMAYYSRSVADYPAEAQLIAALHTT